MTYPYENLENFTLPALIDRSAKLYGSQAAVSFVGNKPLNYSSFYDQVIELSNTLQAQGINKGDKVLILSENMPNWGMAYFAITYFGAIAVPVLPDFHPSDVHHIIRHSEAKAAFVSTRHQATIEECENSGLNFVVNLDSLTIIDELTQKSSMSDSIKDIAKKISKKEEANESQPEQNDLAVIIYTSGTTGHSKGVMLTHENLVTNALKTHAVIKILPEDVFLSILPLAHTFECTVGLLVPILHGSSIQYVEKTPTPSVLLKAFEVARPTMMLSVPLVIEKIFKNKVLSKMNGSFITRNLYKVPFFRKKLNKIAGKKLMETFGGRLRFFGLGGAALPAYVEDFLHEAEFPYTVGYGLTETSPIIAGTPVSLPTKLKSTGPALPGVEVKIKDPNPETGEGEICTKSSCVMVGYYKDEEKTKEILDEDGWFYTGDLGYIDEDGYIFISGRSKNVIVGPSGENIYPEQIESVINQNEVVLDSLVMERDGKIIAKIHLDYELIDKMFHGEDKESSVVLKGIQDLLEEMRIEVNSQVSSFSRMVKFEEQIEPFVKTPTKKIKRYLYTNS